MRDVERLRWPVVIQPLLAAEGGGFLAVVPDLLGWMSDGDTPEQALANARDAMRSWIEAANDLGHAIPRPMWYSDPETAPAVMDIAEPGTQTGTGLGAGKRLEGHGPDRK